MTGELLEAPPLPWEEVLSVPAWVRVGIVRESRGHCARCRQRRVLYRLEIRAPGGVLGVDSTEARCAPCWGIRHEETD